MAGLDKSSPIPTEIKLHQKSREMEISFDDGSHFRLSYEFLRVYSPSAEVRGHGPGQETLQTGKRNVEIESVDPIGNWVQVSATRFAREAPPLAERGVGVLERRGEAGAVGGRHLGERLGRGRVDDRQRLSECLELPVQVERIGRHFGTFAQSFRNISTATSVNGCS